MKQLILLFPLISLITACAAGAGSSNRLPTNEEVAIFNETAAYDDQIVCRREVELGTQFRRRVCRTRIQMTEIDERMSALQDRQRDDVDF